MGTVNYLEQFLHTSEPVLFETNTPMDKKHTYDFNKFNFTKRSPALFYLMIFMGAIQILASFAAFAIHKIPDGILSLVLGMICIFFPFLGFKKTADDSFKSCYYNGNVNNYKFYQEYFVNSDHFTMSVIPYNIITEAHETEEYFFLYVSKHQAHIIPKNSFIINTPQEMRVMLSMNLGNRFTVHCI